MCVKKENECTFAIFLFRYRPLFVVGSVVLLNVLGCRLTYLGQAETNAEARFSIALRPRKPEGSLGRTATSTLTQPLNCLLLLLMIAFI